MTKIISLRGTNGSGKSTIVRAVMSKYSTSIEMEYPGRRKPTGYILKRYDGSSPLFVPGHYEIANGGIDTLPSLDFAYELIEEHYLTGMNVLYEGKNMSDGTNRLLALKKRGHAVAVALIDETVSTCLASVRKRGHTIKSETVQRLHAKSARDAEIFERAGAEVFRGDRAAVLKRISRWLNIEYTGA